MAEKEVFEYTYSAPHRSEVQKIREKYLSREVTKLDQLRALDAGVTATYPIYKHLVKQDRERIAPDILRLAVELALGIQQHISIYTQ